MYPAKAELNNHEDDENEDFEQGESIQIWGTWGDDLQDGVLSYYMDHGTSLAGQQAVRSAIEEWDMRIVLLEIEEVSNKTKSNIVFEFEDSKIGEEEGEPIAGQTYTTINELGFMDKAEITIATGASNDAYEPAAIGHIAKHEVGHALGLGHANFEGNLMVGGLADGTATISQCEIKAVVGANFWKIGQNEKNSGDSVPEHPENDFIKC